MTNSKAVYVESAMQLALTDAMAKGLKCKKAIMQYMQSAAFESAVQGYVAMFEAEFGA